MIDTAVTRTYSTVRERKQMIRLTLTDGDRSDPYTLTVTPADHAAVVQFTHDEDAKRSYRVVVPDGSVMSCGCPDFKYRVMRGLKDKCRHMAAVEDLVRDGVIGSGPQTQGE